MASGLIGVRVVVIIEAHAMVVKYSRKPDMRIVKLASWLITTILMASDINALLKALKRARFYQALHNLLTIREYVAYASKHLNNHLTFASLIRHVGDDMAIITISASTTG